MVSAPWQELFQRLKSRTILSILHCGRQMIISPLAMNILFRGPRMRLWGQIPAEIRRWILWWRWRRYQAFSLGALLTLRSVILKENVSCSGLNMNVRLHFINIILSDLNCKQDFSNLWKSLASSDWINLVGHSVGKRNHHSPQLWITVSECLVYIESAQK